MRAFRQFDVDQTGKITFENLKAPPRDLGEDMRDEEIAEMIEKADLDADGMRRRGGVLEGRLRLAGGRTRR